MRRSYESRRLESIGLLVYAGERASRLRGHTVERESPIVIHRGDPRCPSSACTSSSCPLKPAIEPTVPRDRQESHTSMSARRRRPPSNASRTTVPVASRRGPSFANTTSTSSPVSTRQCASAEPGRNRRRRRHGLPPGLEGGATACSAATKHIGESRHLIHP